MLAATLLALGSAAVHAAWNLLIKTSDDRALAAWGQFAAAAALGLVAMAVVGPPGWGAAPYLLVTAAVHVVYVEALVGAYTHGDFSLSYPLARGGGAVLAAVASAVVLGDRLSPLGWAAIAVAGAGLVALRGRGGADGDPSMRDDGPPGPDARPDGPGPSGAPAGDRTAVLFALLTAASIATYTVVDSAGARDAPSGVSYGLASVTAAGVAVSVSNGLRPARRARASALRAGWRRHLAGGAGTLVAYTMVLVAVRSAPVGYVTMLRESSVVVGALVGWLALGEGMGRRRLVAALVILAGLVLLVAAR